MARSELLWACNSPLPHIRDGPHHQDLPPPPPPLFYMYMWVLLLPKKEIRPTITQSPDDLARFFKTLVLGLALVRAHVSHSANGGSSH